MPVPVSLLIPIIYLTFVGLGLPDSVLGVAWPSMRASLGAPLEAAGLISIVLTSCAAIASVSNGLVTRRFGPGPLVLASLLLSATGLFGYSQAPSYIWILVSAIPLGLGAGTIDSTLNGYMASHHSSRHMNWLHASWGIGATAGPLVMTAAMAGGGSWRRGYLEISCFQASLALLFLISLNLWRRAASGAGSAAAVDSPAGEGAEGECTSGKIHGLGRPEPWIQVGMYALYAACEFTAGIWTASMLIESRGIAPEVAGRWIALLYGGIMVGRALTGLVSDRLGNRTMVRIGLAIALAGSVLIIVRGADYLALPGLLLLGLGFAPIYPCLMHETPRRFDKETYRTIIGFQIGAACIGGSVLPGLVGLLASAAGLEVVGPCVALFIVLLAGLGELLNART